MSSPPLDAPDPTLPRLFIGGLTSSISTAALLRLLSKFAKPGPIHRHPHRPFAHVTVIPLDQSSLTRCIASLNNTTWCGASLRVQRARQHFWHRLQQERQLGDECVDVEKVDGDENVQGDDQEKHQVPFERAAKGRHTRFSFPDMGPEETVQLLQLGDVISNDDGRAQQDISHGRSAPINVDCARSMSYAPSAQGVKTKSAALSSTMDLFGLHTPLFAPALNTNATEANSNNRAIKADATRPLKRLRMTSLERKEQESTGSTAREPDAIDIESEKKAAFSVLHDMFPGLSPPTMTKNEIVAAHRRLGLFRKLPMTRSALKSSGSPSTQPRTPKPLRSHQNTLNAPTGQGDGTTNGGKVRRVGLYKKLFSTSSAASSHPAT